MTSMVSSRLVSSPDYPPHSHITDSSTALGDQYDQLSLDLNSLLNISPAATPQGPVGAPLSPNQHNDMDIDMV